MTEPCEASLDRPGTDSLDLSLVHRPTPAVSLRETLAALARSVGVSNATAAPLGWSTIYSTCRRRSASSRFHRGSSAEPLRVLLGHRRLPPTECSSPSHLRDTAGVFGWDLGDVDRERLDGRNHDEPVPDSPAQDWTANTFGTAE